MPETILVTGGAGFIGRRVVARLVAGGHHVRVLDSLIEQVHGDARPALPGAELIHADVRDETAVLAAVRGVDSVVHLAAEVGVGQSMYAVERYVSVNEVGTAVLFEALIKHPVRRVVTASSMSIYGEGLYRDVEGAAVETAERRPGTGWDPVDAHGRALVPVATPEWKRPSLASVYALGKYVQERLTLTLSAAYGMEGVALRLFNVYGPGQALSNPYTGVLAIFASRLLNGQRPMIFEDGEQRRDFVNVEDVARAFEAALFRPGVGGVYNIGSGAPRTVNSVGRDLAAAMGVAELTPDIAGKARVGDIRHCFGDASLAATELGWRAEADWAEGMRVLAAWVAEQTADDRVDEAKRELETRGLVA